MNDRMMATSWRFEQNKGNPHSTKALQEARIAQYEKESRELRDIQKRNMEAFKTNWNNEFDDVNRAYVRKNLSKAERDELGIIKKANIMVRREAIKQLYLNELRSYEVELNQKGLCLHKERL